MSNQIITIFGTYDFLSKSLPGMALIIGLALLFPKGSVPIPNITENFLVLISILIIVGLIGTLIGESVHGLANILENSMGTLGRLKLDLTDTHDTDSSSQRKPTVTRLRNSENNHPVESDYGFWKNRKIRAKNWYRTQRDKLRLVIIPHRKLFKNHLDEEKLPDSGETFTEQHLIQKAVNEYNIQTQTDIDQVYSVVVSTLTEAGYQRPFRYQSRYSFCRSMWLVLWILGIMYSMSLIGPLLPSFIQNLLSPFYYDFYLIDTLSSAWILLTVIVLFLIGLIFAFVSGSYKRYYIQYLISGLYVLEASEDEQSPSQPQYAS